NVIFGRPAAYQSSNPSVATINNTGLIVGIAAGFSNVSVIVDGIVTTKRLTVIAPTVTTIVLSPNTANVFVGSSTTLTAEVRDQFGGIMLGQSLVWSSATPSVATVAAGKVSGVSLGSATIRASIGSVSGAADVNVQNVPVASVSVTPATATVVAGGTVSLVVTARDGSGNVLSNRPATFVSSAPQFATVDANGVVSALSTGSATVTATVEGKSASSAITVSAPPPAPVASVTYTLNSSSLNVGQTTAGVVHTFDANGVELTGRAVTFASVNPTVASVASNGTVTALSGGTASVSATSEGKVAYAAVTVSSAPSPVATVLVSSKATTFSPGDTSSLAVVAKDASGNILLGRTTSYATSNPTIVSVSTAGLVKGLAKGNATITATVGGQAGALGFNIVPDTAPTGATPPPPPPPVASVAVAVNASALTVGQGTQASAVLRDANSNVLTGAIAWSSSNTSVATVNSAGYVTALGVGSASITASSGGVSGSTGVTVTAPTVQVASVTVALNSTSITVGQTTTAVATARDASNNVISGLAFTWTTTPTSGVASMSTTTGASISVTGSSTGTTSVVATAGGIAGSAALSVTAPVITPVALPLSPTLLNLQKPAVTGQQWVVNSGGSFQNALNSAQRGDEIVLQAGATFTGNFVLPTKTGTSSNGWITIRSSQLSSLPVGVRVGPSQASLMPRVLTPNADAAIKTAPGTSGWWIAGVEVSLVPTATVNYGLILLGDGSGAQNTLAKVPSDIVLDRDYIHATATLGTSRCVGLNSASTDIHDSYLFDCHGKGYDTQAIGGWNGPGPYRIVNNMLAGAGENVMFGGADPAIGGLIPSDIEIRRNYIWTPKNWAVTWTKKNLFELKNARRVLVEGNVLDGSWADAQVGFGFMLYSTNQSGGCNWCRVTDVMIRGNMLKNVAGGYNISGGQTAVDTLTRRIALIANVVDSVKYANNNILLQVLSNTNDLTVDSLVAVGGGGVIKEFLVLDPNPAATNFTFRNAVVEHGQYGLFSSFFAIGEASLGTIKGTKNYNNVSIIGASRSGYPNSVWVSSESQAPLSAAIRSRVAAATAGVEIP
ncbi:MAG: Ig-like domain-containing protein, partial [Gemmatimonadaceae bacterium]